MYMFIETLNFHRSFWLSSSRDDIAEGFSSDLRDIFKEAILVNLYIPLRAGMDLLVWISSDTPELIARFRSVLRGGYGGYLDEVLSFLAVYRPSQCILPHQDLREYVARASKDPYEYIVAYPMKNPLSGTYYPLRRGGRSWLRMPHKQDLHQQAKRSDPIQPIAMV
jgi:chlorite dismutase